MKKYIKMNDNDNYLSLGNFCRVFKNISYNKVFTNQTNICMILFSDDTLSDTLINNYCVGYRSINMKYKNKYLEYKDKYKKDKLSLINLINELINLLHGSIDNLYSYEDINKDELLIKLCKKLYNIAKNDKNINGEFTIKLNNYIKNNKYYECIIQILFYIILDNKQPINEDDIIKDTIENILNKTNISINDLEKFLMLNFKDGVNYIYELKRLVKENNAYACFEMGYMEYKGEITGIPRYNKAYEYLLISSLNNHPRACLLIGEMLLTNKIGNGSEEDKLVALKYLTKASELGSIAALNKLGLYYLNIDKSKAIEYFNIAIKEDYVYSYNNLGKIYEDMKDYKKAFDYYMKSALKEESWACNKLGEFYRKGIYVEKNMKLAFDYYNLSTNVPIYLLEYYSKYNLAKYFYQCGNYELGIEKDIEKAITLYDESSNHGVIESSIELLNIYIDKYLENKNKDNLLKVNYYKDKILNSRKYNNEICAKIEKILSKIEVNNEKNIYN